MAIEDLALKNKLSLLWIILDFATLSMLVLMIIDQNNRKQLIAGLVQGEQITPSLLLVARLMSLGPMVMVILSQTLND